MAQSQLVLHRGARPVTLEELAAVPAPPAEGRWRPQPHIAVLTAVKETLGEFGYSVKTGAARALAKRRAVLRHAGPGDAAGRGRRLGRRREVEHGQVLPARLRGRQQGLLLRQSRAERGADGQAEAHHELDGAASATTSPRPSIGSRATASWRRPASPGCRARRSRPSWRRATCSAPSSAASSRPGTCPASSANADPHVRGVQGPDLLVAPERRHHGPRGDLQGRPAEVRPQDHASDGHAVPGPASQLAPRKGVDRPMSQPEDRRQSCPRRRRHAVEPDGVHPAEPAGPAGPPPQEVQAQATETAARPNGPPPTPSGSAA